MHEPLGTFYETAPQWNVPRSREDPLPEVSLQLIHWLFYEDPWEKEMLLSLSSENYYVLWNYSGLVHGHCEEVIAGFPLRVMARRCGALECGQGSVASLTCLPFHLSSPWLSPLLWLCQRFLYSHCTSDTSELNTQVKNANSNMTLNKISGFKSSIPIKVWCSPFPICFQWQNHWRG